MVSRGRIGDRARVAGRARTHAELGGWKCVSVYKFDTVLFDTVGKHGKSSGCSININKTETAD